MSSPPPKSFGLLLVGAPKSGKTSFALQFPRPYIADCDNNIYGPMTYLERQKKNPNFHYDVIDVDDNGREIPVEKRWTRLTECVRAAATHPEIKTIVVDSLSKVSDYLIAHILHYEKVSTMRIQDWQPYQNLLKKLVIFTRSCGKNVIFCAHEHVEKDELDGVLRCCVALPSKLAHHIGGLFTDVWRAEYSPGAGGQEGRYMIRALSSARMSLGNSINLPPVFPMDFAAEPKLVERFK